MRANPKIRHVWGHAIHHILIKRLISQPLLDGLMKHETPIYIGKDIHKDMPYLILKATKDCGTFYCLDFSKFDSTIPGSLVKMAWDLMYEMFDISDHVDQLVDDFCYDSLL